MFYSRIPVSACSQKLATAKRLKGESCSHTQPTIANNETHEVGELIVLPPVELCIKAQVLTTKDFSKHYEVSVWQSKKLVSRARRAKRLSRRLAKSRIFHSPPLRINSLFLSRRQSGEFR